MIREFWVRNFLSIQDKQGLSFIAKGPISELVVEMSKGTFLYKLGILYGPNASGKSNMLIALNEIFRLLVSSKSNAKQKIKGYYPFALSKDEPTEMYVSFYASNVRYDYDVKFNGSCILSEILNYYPNGFKALFYERFYIGDNVQAKIKFGPTLKLFAKTQDSIRENTLNNHSVLSVCNKMSMKEDIKPFAKLHSYIMANYHEVDGDEENGIVDILSNAYKDKKKLNFFTLMLRKADLNILKYRPTIENRIIPNEYRERISLENIPERMKALLLKSTKDAISFLNHCNRGDFEISMKLQSKGTLKYIRILDALYDMITKNQVYYLDELGEDLHYDLLFYYLNVFIFNSNRSQLIITSQETTLLSQDMINENRGVVWFVTKDPETASSEYARGDSFGLPKNVSLHDLYRAGRLGCKPELGSIFIDLD